MRKPSLLPLLALALGVAVNGWADENKRLREANTLEVKPADTVEWLGPIPGISKRGGEAWFPEYEMGLRSDGVIVWRKVTAPDASRQGGEAVSKRPDEIQVKDWPKYYDARFYCGNCGEHFIMLFKKGIKKHEVACPNCECTVKP